ncbi:MAG: glutamine-hydrolyzing GMP synthase, partial [Thermodesulfobacteriota bacterium]|nr:glutamine-hydrolyzing GMP synthase [Thermodesulfobacteriota bacterium]
MILIIDFGSQYNQLIARRVREEHVYCQIEPPWITIDQIKALAPQGIILSGGPASIYEKNSPKADRAIFDLGVPILGICYGMQYMVDALGGEVKKAQKREYGFAKLQIKESTGIFQGVAEETKCWMSHGDTIARVPKGFRVIASTPSTRVAATTHPARDFYGLQFHPEV